MRRFTISLVAFLSAICATGQNHLNITEQSVERCGQNVKVTFKVTADQKAVRQGEKIMVTATLIPGKATEAAIGFDPFYVAGHQQQKILMQKSRLNRKGTSVPVFITNGETYTFVETIPYDNTIKPKSYELSLSAIRMGCCGTEKCLAVKESFTIGSAIMPVVAKTAPKVTKVHQARPEYPFLNKIGSDIKDQRGVSVRFPLAQTELDPTFSFNEKSLKDIIDAISLVTKDDLAKLETIDIAGYASPEGDAKKNLELAAGRAKALKDYIIGKFGFDEDMFNVTSGGTDWAGLKELVIKSDMPYKDEIIGIIDNTPEENRQAKIAALAGGRPYKSMRDVLYPQLRDACYIRVWFSEKEDVAAKEINEAIADINAGKHEEALKKLMAHKDDSRAWNAIGCVKVLMEDLKQAREWFRKAAEAGDHDAAANLKGIEEILK